MTIRLLQRNGIYVYVCTLPERFRSAVHSTYNTTDIQNVILKHSKSYCQGTR